MHDTYARSTDPGTSWEAADSVKGLEATRRRIIECLRLARTACTDEDLIDVYSALADDRDWPKVSDSGLRTRRKELVDDGRIRAVEGKHGRTKSGRRCRLWELVPSQPSQQSLL